MLLTSYKENKSTRKTTSKEIKSKDSNTYMAYLSFRTIGINTIKDFASLFQVKKETLYKAISFLDRIYLSTKDLDEKDILDISKVCLLISIKFTEICTSYPIGLLLEKIWINDYQTKELHCLNLLSYSLTDLSSYDWLLSLITTEFKLNSKNILLEVYQKAICVLNEFVEDIRFLDFNPKETAIGLIKITSQLLDLRLFIEKGSNIKFCRNCCFVLHRIITESNLIVFIPRSSLLTNKDVKYNGMKNSSAFDSGSTSSSLSDSNDLA